MKIKCIDDKRCQGSLTVDKEYEWTGRVKKGKVDLEVEVVDNNGRTKWFVNSRFAAIMMLRHVLSDYESRGLTGVEAYIEVPEKETAGAEEPKEDIKEESKMAVKKLNAKDMVEALAKFLVSHPEWVVTGNISKARIKESLGSGFECDVPVFIVAFRVDGVTAKIYYAFMNEDYIISTGSDTHLKYMATIDNELNDKLHKAVEALVVELRKTAPSMAELGEADKKEAEVKHDDIKKEMSAPVKKESSKVSFRDFLEKQGVTSKLIDGLEKFREFYKLTDEKLLSRVPQPKQLFLGGEVWNDVLAALLNGENVLLEGGKATGKNTLTENLSFAFGRPQWDVSFHSNITASQLVGNDTFRDGQVVFNPGMVYLVGQNGGFGILDEINMAKNESAAILHSALDNRRELDVPGYDMLKFHEATRFIATMNYGYSGTREMNEALVSRFTVISVPELDGRQLASLLHANFPNVKVHVIDALVGLFADLRNKAKNTEISTKGVDLRGIQSALRLMQSGIPPKRALERGIVCKAFEESERQIIRDVISTRVPEAWTASNILVDSKEMVFDFTKVR